MTGIDNVTYWVTDGEINSNVVHALALFCYTTSALRNRHTPDFIKMDEWPQNSPDLNPLDFCVWGLMLEKYTKHKPKPTTREELKVVLQNIWDSLEQGKIDKAVLAFWKRLRACVQVEGGHFEHALN